MEHSATPRPSKRSEPLRGRALSDFYQLPNQRAEGRQTRLETQTALRGSSVSSWIPPALAQHRTGTHECLVTGKGQGGPGMQALKPPGTERGFSTWHLMQLAPCRAVDPVKPGGGVLSHSYSYLCSCSPLPSSSTCFQVPPLSLLHLHTWPSRVLG